VASNNSVSYSVEVDGKQLAKVVSALKREADGKQLARDLVKELRVIGQPALLAVRRSILSMDSHSEVTPGLRASTARATRLSVRSTGKRAGISIYTSKSGMPRGFKTAPKHLNAVRGWRHPVFGTDRWVAQVGKPGWFDDTLKPFKEPAKKAAGRVLQAAARRISVRSK